MPGDQERRRRLLEKKSAKRKERKRAVVRSDLAMGPPGSRALVRTAATWPLYECWINQNWNDVERPGGGGALAEILIARRSPTGQIGIGVFLVDLGCLGVKNSYAKVLPSEGVYASFFEHLDQATPLGRTDLDLAARVIEEGIAYAKRWGFRPSQGYYEAAPFLAGAEPEKADVVVPLGQNGKPFYVSGPNDHPKQVVAQLTRTAGPGNFHYIVDGTASQLGIPANVLEKALGGDEADGDE
ncbi:MAG: hypothetical protein ACRDIY_02030 [Chloroflexota bacterium]